MAKSPKNQKPETTEVETKTTEPEVEKVQEATPEVQEPVQEQVKEEPKVQEQPKDKYEESRKIDLDTSYKLIKETLKRSDLSDSEKLEVISNGTNIAYKAVIEEFEEYDREVSNGLTEDPKAFGKKVEELFNRLKRILEDEDSYVSTAKLMILLLLFKKYHKTSFVPSVYSLYADYFTGKEEDYVEYQYIMASLYTIANNSDPDIVRRRINFNKADFKYGKRLEELFINLYN